MGTRSRYSRVIFTHIDVVDTVFSRQSDLCQVSGLTSPTDVVAGASLSVIVVTLGLVFGASLDYHLTAYKPSSLSVSSGLVGQALSGAHKWD